MVPVDGSKPSRQEKRLLKLMRMSPDCPKGVSVSIVFKGIQDAEVHILGDVPEYVVRTAVFFGLPVAFKKSVILNGNRLDSKLLI
jgi:hypothetical protein